ncbi:phage holin family protein [Lutibacter sp.]|jgi:putative membrane protein|uniref:phage holin family protein n=1 Tax=Lutibacter sp. TaxID=1925666 RepID=UPI001A32C928|nr:phage holin family protein [Lutibacter sp.]MBI9039979.1 phage holin family protein [Lutibacter sp.]
MKTILRMLLTAVAVVVIANFLPGVTVTNFVSAMFLAIVLAFLRITVKPILVILTLPATILTLGLFLLVINAVIILLAGYFVDGFEVAGFWTALLFSILLSMLQSILYSFLKEDDKK